MKRNIIKGILFPVITLFTIAILIAFIIPNDNARDRRVKGYNAAGNENLGVMLFGNSDLYSGFIPSIMYDKYNIKSYNCGKSKANVYEVYEQMKEAFKTQSPDVVVLETDVLGYKVIKHPNNIFTRAYWNHDYWRQEGASKIIKMKGYVYSSDIVSSGDKKFRCSRRITKLFEDNLEYVKCIKELCEKNGTELLLMELPSATSWADEYHDAVESVLPEISSNFIDYNYILDEIGFDAEKDSRDGGNHLNIYGAIKTSSYLADYIHDNYSVRTEEGNKSFELASKLLQEQIEKL